MTKLEDFYNTMGEAKEQAFNKSAADIENSLKALLDSEMNELRRRIEDLENAQTNAVPIPQLTPGDDLNDVKQSLNFLINYLNIGIKHG